MFIRTTAKAANKDKRASKASPPLTSQTLRILGITVFLSQLPLLIHFPLWLTIPGIALVLAKTFLHPRHQFSLPPALTIIFVLVAVIAVFFHYGHIFGRDPCVAFLYLLLGFKFVETKRAYDASLLIILCAFLLLTQFFFKQSLFAAILSIPAMYFIGLSLFALQRGAIKTDTRTMVHMTSTLFLQAMPIAALLFVVVPRISQAPMNGFGNGNNDGQAQTGLSSRMSPGSIASLSKSNEVAFRVEFKNTPPLPHQRYWRGPVLTGFDGHDWFALPRHNNPGSVSVSGRKIEYTITQPASYQPWLLALDTPSETPVAINNPKLLISVNDELQINTANIIDQPLRYTAKSTISDRFKPSRAPDSTNLLTTTTNPKAQSFARKLRAKYNDNADVAEAILQWFNQEAFHYTLNPPQLGNHSIDEFIFNTRSGFCEHYAGSFVFMLRAAGIPARVVTGYQGGKMNAGYMIVRQSDAHAWAEAYIGGHWIRYDPTSAVAPQRVEQGLSDVLGNDLSQSYLERLELPMLSAASLQWDKINFAWQKMIIDFDSSKQQAIWKKLGIEKPSALMIVIAFILAAVVWALIILKPLSELQRQKLKPCEKQWNVLCNKLARFGLNKNPAETHSNYIERACKKWPNYSQQLRAIVHSYQRGMYASEGSDPRHHQQMAGQMKLAFNEIKRLN